MQGRDESIKYKHVDSMHRSFVSVVKEEGQGEETLFQSGYEREVWFVNVLHLLLIRLRLVMLW